MSKKLYVGNLSFQAAEDQVRELFGSFGEVANVNVVSDRYTGRSRGFAFVEMASDDAANKAREALNGKPFQDRNLTVDWARPESDRPAGGSGGPRRDRDSGPRRSFRR